MNDPTPQRKVLAGAFAGAVAAILCWLIDEFTSVQIPAHIALEIYTVLLFPLQYFVKNHPIEVPE